MDNLPQEFDDFGFSYTPSALPLLSSGATYGSMSSQDPALFKENTDGEYHLSHHSYGYAHGLWSPWEMQHSQAHAMIPISQMRSSAEHMIQFPLPYPPPQIAHATPIGTSGMPYFPSLERPDADDNLSNFWDSSSPSLSSDDSTSSPSPPLPSPPAQQQPLVIHQPRPYRRIPIVSLSQLASACEEVETKPPQSDSALSPLPFEYLDFNINSSASGTRQLMSQHSFPFLADKMQDRTFLCACGCMEHYIRR